LLDQYFRPSKPAEQPTNAVLIAEAKLVIIDGIIPLHRAEFAGRGTLADRQQRLNSMLHKAIRLAEIFKEIIERLSKSC
jgi:RecA/RadA recombinase